MSNGFNKVIIMGNLTRDPELRYTNSNLAICKVGLAINQRRKQGDEWVEVATFVDVTIFGKRAEAFEKYHKKGAVAFFEGSLRLDQWPDKDTGQKRQKLYVVADQWEFVGGDKQQQGTHSQDRGSTDSNFSQQQVDDFLDDEPPL